MKKVKAILPLPRCAFLLPGWCQTRLSREPGHSPPPSGKKRSQWRPYEELKHPPLSNSNKGTLSQSVHGIWTSTCTWQQLSGVHIYPPACCQRKSAKTKYLNKIQSLIHNTQNIQDIIRKTLIIPRTRRILTQMSEDNQTYPNMEMTDGSIIW